MKKAWRIVSVFLKVAFGVAGIGSAAIGLVACFSPVDWPLGALMLLVGSTVFSVAAGVLHKKFYLMIIPATAIAGCYPIASPLPWIVAKLAGRHYRFNPARTIPVLWFLIVNQTGN